MAKIFESISVNNKTETGKLITNVQKKLKAQSRPISVERAYEFALSAINNMPYKNKPYDRLITIDFNKVKNDLMTKERYFSKWEKFISYGRTKAYFDKKSNFNDNFNDNNNEIND